MIALGYDRVSTAKQAGAVNLEQRYREAMKDHCQRRGWTFRKLYTDPGLSGKNAQRPGLQAAIEAAIKHKGVIVFYDLSRFSRSLIDAVTIAQQLKAHGAAMSSCTEAIDLTDDSPAAQLTFHILVACAEFQRRIIGAKVKFKNAATVAEKGYRTMARQPTGWRIDKATGLRVPCERETALMAHVRTLAETLGIPEAARVLEASGTPTIASMRKWGKTGPWTRSKVRSILADADKAQTAQK